MTNDIGHLSLARPNMVVSEYYILARAALCYVYVVLARPK